MEVLGVSSRKLPLSSSSGNVEIVPALNDVASPGGADADGDVGEMDITVECARREK